jgi:hypothetical protein
MPKQVTYENVDEEEECFDRDGRNNIPAEKATGPIEGDMTFKTDAALSPDFGGGGGSGIYSCE